MGGCGMSCLRLKPQWEYAGIGAEIAVPVTASQRPACTTRAQAGGPRPGLGCPPAAAKGAKHEPIARSDTIGGCGVLCWRLRPQWEHMGIGAGSVGDRIGGRQEDLA
eukprot:SAG11_NODE_7410_length_1148_cov_1.185891_2_plen_107_part_00